MVFVFFSRAEISDIRLEEAQFQLLKNTPAQDSQIHALLGQKTTLGLDKWSDSDVTEIIRILHSQPAAAQQESAGLATCGTVSARLLDGEWSEISFPAILSGSKAPYLRANLLAYFQFQLFDFYYSNGLGDYLKNPEYVALLQPAAVFKLLKDFRTEERLVREIRFVINNSGFEMFPISK